MGKPKLKVQGAESRVCIRRYRLECFALSAQPRKAEGALGAAGEARAARPIVDGGFVDVEDPPLAPVG